MSPSSVVEAVAAEDAGDWLVELGEPHRSGVEHVLDGVKVLYMGCSGDVPGICASSRTDAELFTCEAHDADPLLPTSCRLRWNPASLASARTPF